MCVAISWTQLKMSLTKAFQRSRRRGGRSKKSKTSSGRTPGGAWSDTESEAAASSVRSAAEEAALSAAAALSMPNSPNVGPRQHHRRNPSSESVPHSTPVTPSVNEIRRLTKNTQQQLQPQLSASTKGSVERCNYCIVVQLKVMRIGKLLRGYRQSFSCSAVLTPQHYHWYAATRFAFPGGQLAE